MFVLTNTKQLLISSLAVTSTGFLFYQREYADDVHGYRKVAVWNGHIKDGDRVMIKGTGEGGGGYGSRALISHGDANGSAQ